MWTASDSGVTQVYVMRKLHEEKMKKMELPTENRRNLQASSHEGEQVRSQSTRGRRSTDSGATGGCLSTLVFKKIHPT